MWLYLLGTNMSTKARQHLIKVIHIKYHSDIDDMLYEGDFTIKKLSILDSAALGVRKAQLNGGMHHNPEKPGYGIDEDTDSFNAMIAHLQISITNAPKWWNMETISDVGLITEIYRGVIEFENSFHHRRRATNTSSGSMGLDQNDGNSNPSQTNPEGKSRTLVDKEVQDSLEL